MREELVRVENGCFRSGAADYRFDIALACGECIGIYVDEHLTSGTAYLNIFKGTAHYKSGTVFLRGRRTGSLELRRWIRQHSAIADRQRFTSRELTAWDFLMALGKTISVRDLHAQQQRLGSQEAALLCEQMGIGFSWKQKLTALPLLDYYRLFVFRVWLQSTELLILDRFTEILRQKDLEKLMRCVELLQETGTAVLLFDMNEEFLYRHAGRIDVIKDKKTRYRLYPEEYDSRLYEILGWKHRSGSVVQHPRPDAAVVLAASGLTFAGLPPLNLQIRSGEIAFLQDENYSTASRIRDCFLRGQSWQSGSVVFDGAPCDYRQLTQRIGTQIGIQIERPDRLSGELFDDLTALDNLSLFLVPKAGHRLIRKGFVSSIQGEAAAWFDREALQRPLREWSLPERLRFSYFKWYLLRPRLLICFFPFAGQESAYHEMIIDLLVTCAQRDMAIWIVSSGIDEICDKTTNREFLERLHFM